MNNVTLPKWLDTYIFIDLGAKYCKSNKDMVVLDWDKTEILNYLGTYFPRSFAESYTIFSNYFRENAQNYASLNEISIFDFGCGTGGEIIGLIYAINEFLPNIKSVFIQALDGNFDSLRIFEKVTNEYSSYSRVSIKFRIVPFTIDDFYDMSIITNILEKRFDFIITFKAICEFVTRQQFEEKNPYEYFINNFRPKLSDIGLICITDITTYANVSQEWLPKMLDNAIRNSKAIQIKGNEGFNESFYIFHSRKQNDLSKIAWRLLTK